VLHVTSLAATDFLCRRQDVRLGMALSRPDHQVGYGSLDDRLGRPGRLSFKRRPPQTTRISIRRRW